MENKHLQAIPADVLTQVQTKINEAMTLLQPYVMALTSAERHSILKMGEKSLSFVEKAYELANQNPALRPSYLDMSAFAVDFGDAHGLWVAHNSSQQLYENIADTQMVAGSEAYQAALVFYNSAKMAAAQDIPGAKAVYEELRKRFPHGKRGSSESETETITETIKNDVRVS
ncbi:hypothetical protein FACS189456_2570 [Bacteroidia bacterium]|nr:hypothetical protein FACS189456_2570 [Bacteroidia bacterium]